MRTAKQILEKKHLIIENGRTVEAHTHLVIEAMEEYANQFKKSDVGVNDNRCIGCGCKIAKDQIQCHTCRIPKY